MSVGRNDPCPCGSGKKHKKCCGMSSVVSHTTNSETAGLFKQAQRHLDAGRYPEAIEQYHRILKINPNHVDARHYLGLAIAWQGDIEHGLLDVEHSVRLRPTDPIFNNNLAMLYEEVGRLQEAETHFQRSLKLKPDYLPALRNLAKLLWRRNKYYLAGSHLKDLLRRDPVDRESRALLAEVYGAVGEIASMCKEFETVLAQDPLNVKVCIRYAELLSRVGRSDEAVAVCQRLLALQNPDPDVRVLCTLAIIEEHRNCLDEAEYWLRQALQRAPQGPAIRRLMSTICLRRGDLPGAHDWLQGVDVSKLPLDEQYNHGFALGDLLDKEGRHEEAFSAYRQGNEAYKQLLEKRYAQRFYDPERIQRQYGQLKVFFTRERVTALKAFSPVAAGDAEPLFIVGFPRSGTTLLEQMLAVHPAIQAGDELSAMNLLRTSSAARLGSLVDYPECLNELQNPKKHQALQGFREFYLTYAREAGALRPDRTLFTDKMPLNEEHLGLIHLVFPQSPIVHMIRHPLDVVWSCYSNALLHGYHCALDLESAAFHYVQTLDLVEHYLSNIPLRYIRLCYEDLVEKTESELRRLLQFLGLPWDSTLLEFHRSKRVARTASYAQVTQKLYSSSLGRWRHYRKPLASAIEILEPCLKKLGYPIH